MFDLVGGIAGFFKRIAVRLVISLPSCPRVTSDGGMAWGQSENIRKGFYLSPGGRKVTLPDETFYGHSMGTFLQESVKRIRLCCVFSFVFFSGLRNGAVWPLRNSKERSSIRSKKNSKQPLFFAPNNLGQLAMRSPSPKPSPNG